MDTEKSDYQKGFEAGKKDIIDSLPEIIKSALTEFFKKDDDWTKWGWTKVKCGCGQEGSHICSLNKK